jgi:WD40 repeat protein
LGELFSGDFTPDGKQIVVGGMDKFEIFLDAITGKVNKKLKKQKEPTKRIQVSVDGKLVAAVLFKTFPSPPPAPVLIWETGSGLKRIEWCPPSMVIGSAWMSDGHFLAATSTSDAVHIWRVN